MKEKEEEVNLDQSERVRNGVGTDSGRPPGSFLRRCEKHNTTLLGLTIQCSKCREERHEAAERELVATAQEADGHLTSLYIEQPSKELRALIGRLRAAIARLRAEGAEL